MLTQPLSLSHVCFMNKYALVQNHNTAIGLGKFPCTSELIHSRAPSGSARNPSHVPSPCSGSAFYARPPASTPLSSLWTLSPHFSGPDTQVPISLGTAPLKHKFLGEYLRTLTRAPLSCGCWLIRCVQFSFFLLLEKHTTAQIRRHHRDSLQSTLFHL